MIADVFQRMGAILGCALAGWITGIAIALALTS
jgi:hypothetical protein